MLSEWKVSRRTALIVGGVVLVLAAIGTFVGTGGGAVEAKIAAEKFVTKRLKAPATADFPSTSEYKAEETEKNVWRVSGYVDAENSFGAKLRSNWVVTMRYDGDSKWSLISCDIN